MEKNKTIIPKNKVTKKLVSGILGKYFEKVELTEFKIIPHGLENTSIFILVNKQKYIIRIYNRLQFNKHERTENTISWELDFMEYMYKKGIPVPEIIYSLNGERLTTVKVDKYSYFVVLNKYVEGRHIKKMTDSHLKEIIQTQALMHIYAKDFKIKIETRRNSEFGFEKMVLKNADKKIKEDKKYEQLFLKLKNIIEELLPNLLKLTENSKKIVIHDDLHEGNLKFEKDKISGIFDFDDATIGTTGADLAKTIFFCGRVLKKSDILDNRIDKLIKIYTKINNLSEKDIIIVKRAFLLSWAAHKIFFFDGTKKDINSVNSCLEYYEYLNNKLWKN